MTDCPWDLNGDGVVDGSDEEWLILNWGPCVPGSKGDFNGDGLINSADIDILRAHLGPCPGVTPPPTVITCNSPTPNFSSGCALLLYYNVQKDGVISGSDEFAASVHAGQGTITDEEYAFVQKARSAGSINALCPGCYSATPPTVVCTPGATRCATDYILETCKPDGTGWHGSICPDGTICKNGECVPESPTPPPNMETRTMALTEGQHTIQISLSGYDTLNATINVSPTGVTCTVGPCNTQGPPGVTTSGWTVTTYLKAGTVTSDVCSWVDSIGGWQNLQWASHVLEAYYVYIGAAGHSVGFSPVTWDDVLGLYYYYINDPTAGNGKIGCGT